MTETDGSYDPQSAAARRTELRELCRPAYDGPQPAGVDFFGWVMTAIGLLTAAGSLIYLAVSLGRLLHGRELAGENLFAAGVALVLTLFLTRVWHGFRTLADWRVAPAVPLRAKVFAATGSALAASLAAGALAVLVFAICAKLTFLGFMEGIGAGGLGKVQLIFSAGVVFFYFLLLWYLFQGLMELRDGARTALLAVLAGTLVLAVIGWIVDATWLAGNLGNHGVRAACLFLGVAALIALVLQRVIIKGDVIEHFRADEY